MIPRRRISITTCSLNMITKKAGLVTRLIADGRSKGMFPFALQVIFLPACSAAVALNVLQVFQKLCPG